MKRLVVTADDFGLALPVNAAVEAAHRRGLLTAASLMVTAPAAADAIERARRLPRLGVGLHLVLVDGKPALPPEELPDLEIGELVYAENIGAYAGASSTYFNGFPPAKVVHVNQGLAVTG